MEAKRVTMRDIAQRAGVHFTTVSRALTRHPSIPTATCNHIRKLADEMGYAPDPMVAALNAYRIRTQAPTYHGNIAWVTNGFTRNGWNTCKTFDLHHKGAIQRAQELGYKVEDFWLREPGMTGRRASKVLAARNIRGLILAPQPKPKMRVKLDWSRFAAVTFGYTLAWPVLHTVTNNTFLSMQTSIRHARALGYRRLGLIISLAANERVNHTWMAGFLERQYHWPSNERLPVCLYETPDAKILSWMKKCRPDAVICHDPLVFNLLKEKGYRIPGDIGYLTPSRGDYPLNVTAIDENALDGGAVAVNFLVGMIHHGEWGIPTSPQRLLTEGSWCQGKTLPRVNITRTADT